MNAACPSPLRPSPFLAAPPDPTARPPAVAPALDRRTSPPFFLLGIATAALVADAVSKLWAVIALEVSGRGTLEIVHGHLDLGVARNPGAAFSLLRDAPEGVRRPLVVAVSLVAVLFVMAAYRRLERARVAARWGFALVLGGALGNLVDRIRDASVVDFIQAHATWGGIDHRWPVFNVADVAISIGVALLLADVVRHRARA